MYSKPDKNLWTGRIDSEDKNLGTRWHQKISFMTYPYDKKKGIACLGFECDEGVKRNKGRVGSANGSDALKSNMGNFAYHLNNSILYDAGKIVASSHLEESQNLLASHITKLLQNNHFPIILGGGHEVAYASFLGLFNSLQKNKDIAVINFDAHFDLRHSHQATSGTPFLQMATLSKSENAGFNYMCLGISKSSNTKALFFQAQKLNVTYILDTTMTYRNFQEILNTLDLFLTEKKHIYISIDSDVFQASVVPSVSAPAARGIDLHITYDVLDYLFSKYKDKIKLVDIAEFNPKYDIADIGNKAICRLVFDITEFIDKTIGN